MQLPLLDATAADRTGSIVDDGRGSIWMRQRGDLIRLRRPLAAGATVVGSSDAHTVLGLVADRAGGVWAGVAGGMAHVEGPGEHPATLGRGDWDGFRIRPVVPMAQTPKGELWVRRGATCLLGPAGCVEAERPTEHSRRGQLFAMSMPADGEAWAAAGWDVLRGTASEPWASWTAVDLPVDPPAQWKHFAPTRDGAMLVASIGGGVLRIRGDLVEVLNEENGLASNQVHHVYVDDRNVAWASTQDAGLCRIDLNRGFSGEAVACFDEAQGLPVDSVQAVIEDAQGRLWLNTGIGLVVIDRAQLDAVAAGEQDAVLPFWLDERDGLPGRSPSARFQPAALRTDDGRLWFAQWAGLGIVDPSAVPSPGPPQVQLSAVEVDGVPQDLAGPLRLASDQRRLSLRYHAVELLRGDQVRYRHRLGADSRWVDAGHARELVLSDLGPGSRTLEVSAGLAGRWSEPARIEVHRAPTFRESALFPISLASVGMLSVMLFGFVRRRALVRRGAELEAAVIQRTSELAERTAVVTRQASELSEQNDRIRVQAARLEEVEAMRTKLVANLSHELRTPLSLIIGPLEHLAAKLAGSGEDAERWLAMLKRNGDRLSGLVDQLLDVARLDRGEVMLRARHLDLASFIRSTVERFEPAAESRGLSLTTELDEASLPAWFDPDLVDKVVTNLLGNALKFTSSGQIAVSLEGEDDFARIEVRDSGPGIPPDEQGRLFERFYQADAHDKLAFGGVGIGLALARDLVELHGGEIGVESSVGAGSTFWFRLPTGSAHLEPDDIVLDGGSLPAGLAAQPAAEEEEQDGDVRPLLVLAEDSDDMRDFLSETLSRVSRVVATANGEEALAAVQAQRPQILVSDILMPKMDGLQLARRLRASPDLADLPIVLVSAKSSQQDLVGGLEVANDYVRKPFHMMDLLERVAAAAGVELDSRSALSEVDRELLDRILTLLDARLPEAAFGVEHMARELAYSRRQLLRHVRRLTGSSPTDLLRTRLLARAQELLDRGAFGSVAEVAAAVGLSRGYFNRAYKAWTGRSPGESLRG